MPYRRRETEDKYLRPWTNNEALDSQLEKLKETLESTQLLTSPQRLPGVIKLELKRTTNTPTSSKTINSTRNQTYKQDIERDNISFPKFKESEPETLDVDSDLAVLVHDYNASLKGALKNSLTYRSKRDIMRALTLKQKREYDEKFLSSVQYDPKYYLKSKHLDQSYPNTKNKKKSGKSKVVSISEKYDEPSTIIDATAEEITAAIRELLVSTDPLDDIDIARSSYRESDPEAEFINQPAEDNTSKNHIRSRLNEALNASNTTNSLATAGMNMTDNDVAFMNITDMGGSSAPNSPRASISSTLLQRPSSTTTRHRPHSASAQRPQSASARSSFHMRPSTAHAASSSRPSSSLAPAEALLGTAAAAVNVASLSSSLLASSGIDGGIATSGAVPPRPGSANARRASSNIVKHGINDIDPIQNSSSSRTRPAFVDSNEVSGGAPSDHYSYFYTEAELAAQAAASYEQQAHRSCCSRPSSSGQQRPLRPQSASQRAQAVRKGSTVNRFDMAHQTAPALSGLNVSVSAAPTTTQPVSPRNSVFGKPKVREQKSFADQLLSTAGSAGLQNDIISNPALKQENQDSVAVLQQMAKESMAQGKTDHTWGIFCTPGFVEALGVEKIYKSECHRSHQADDRLDAALKNVDLTHGLIKNDVAAWAENAIRTGRKVFMGAGGTMKM